MMDSLLWYNTPKSSRRSESFQENDVVTHIDFGKGKVVEIDGDDIWVAFDDEELGTTQCAEDELEFLASAPSKTFSIYGKNGSDVPERCSNEELLEKLTLADFRAAIIYSLEKRPNVSIKRSELPTIVLKELGILTRGTVRASFQKKIFKAIKLLRSKKVTADYTTGVNDRVRLTPSWKQRCLEYKFDYSEEAFAKIKEKSLAVNFTESEESSTESIIASAIPEKKAIATDFVQEGEAATEFSFLPKIPELTEPVATIPASLIEEQFINEEAPQDDDALLGILLGESIDIASIDQNHVTAIEPAVQVSAQQHLIKLEELIRKLEEDPNVLINRGWNKASVSVFSELKFKMVDDAVRNSIMLIGQFSNDSSCYGALMAISGKENFIATVGRTLEHNFEVLVVRFLISKMLPISVAYDMLQQYISNIQDVKEIIDGEQY